MTSSWPTFAGESTTPQAPPVELKPIEIPIGYFARIGMVTNAVVAALGLLLSFYLFRGFL